MGDPRNSAGNDMHDDPDIDLTGDTTLVRAVVAMAKRETLAAGKNRSAILGSLAPIQWLLQQSRGQGLSFGQAIELDNALRSFCDAEAPADAMLETAIGFLQATDDRVAQVITDWRIVDHASSHGHQAGHAQPVDTAIAA